MYPIIPKPQFIEPADGAFSLSAATSIVTDLTADVRAEAETLARLLRPATGYPLPVIPAGRLLTGDIRLTTAGADPALGDEGYALEVGPQGIVIRAPAAAGLYYGVQTLRQLLRPDIECDGVQPGPWTVPAVLVRDTPRFVWRGFMLDVSRHFFGVADVKRMIDLAAAYKLNRFHLHLSDDQGWRIEILSWPALTAAGAQTEVGGGPGGYYTQADYADLVAYAAARHIVVVPEIDMPGHTNAASVAYPQLNGSGKPAALYTGTDVGFSTLDTRSEATYHFIDDVIGELAALTPGEFIHIGGDECHSTHHDDYLHFIARVEAIVHRHGKRMLGWEEIGQATLSPTSVAQYWANGHAVAAARQGAKVILSPADRVYLDMKYDEATPLGLSWAGYNGVKDGYTWDPASYVSGIEQDDVLGVEAPLWSETLETIEHVETMAFPRLPGVAEIGWSAAGRDWAEYRTRLAAHGPRWELLGVDFFRSEDVEWE